ncbi:MAG: hypothetical protein IPG18_17795 [Saprospiraceae bacterium]|nr:hypothetical protein [Saprospiraceae bacterium]
MFGQHNPLITHYSIADYKAHHQNWGITEDNDGNLFTANTSGLLFGNGNQWSLNKLRSNKIIRSVCYHKGKVYSGSHNEIGFWEKDQCGVLTYKNITHEIKSSDLQNEEIWNIMSDGDSLWFQSFSVLMVFDGKKFFRVKMPGTIMFLFDIDGKKYVQTLGKGIYEIGKDLIPSLVPGSQFFNDKVVTGIFRNEKNTGLLITTNTDGIYTLSKNRVDIWNPFYQQHFKTIQINKALVSKNKYVILGSINDGVYIFDESGSFLFHLHTGNGLHNNTVLSIFENKYGDIWLGLDKGIAKIHLSDLSREYKDIAGQYGSLYTAFQKDHKMYIGTNQGVYFYNKKARKTTTNFTLMDGTQGQTWQLFEVEGKLYCGHNEGTFLIDGSQTKKISSLTGGWYTEPLPGSNGKKFLQGHYTGLAVFQLENGQLVFSHRVNGYSFPVKKWVMMNDYLWVTGPNLGITRLLLNKDADKVTQQKIYDNSYGLPDSKNPDLYMFNHTLMVWNGENHYAYDSTRDLFVKNENMSSFPGGFIVRPLMKDEWLRIYPDEVVLMKGDITKTSRALTMTKDYHNALIIDTTRYLFCLDDGYFIDNIKTTKSKRDSLYIFITDSEGNCFSGINPSIPAHEPSFFIHFYDQLFDKGKQYVYRILPVQKEWNKTHTLSYISMSNFTAGDYTVEIKRNDGIAASFSFSVMPPWYTSNPAKMLYFSLLMLLLFVVKKYYDNKLISERNSYELNKTRLVKEHEMEIENQRLVHENRLKNKELANTALQLVQKNEILQEIKDELIQIRKSSNHTLTTSDFQVMMKQINESLTMEDNKKLFDDSFEEIHHIFLKNLKKKFPNLSKDDMQLATYIRMNLTSKEMAPLFNISLRGLENKRYRLRKKLGLPVDENLHSYFNTIED